MPIIKTVVIDYDRSLVNEDYMLNSAVARELQRISELGIVTVLATGRILNEIPDGRVFQLFDFIVAENGSIIYDCKLKGARDLAPPGWKDVKAKIEESLRRSGIAYISGRNIVSLNDRGGFEGQLRGKFPDKDYSLERNASDLMIFPFGINKGFAIRQIVGSNYGQTAGIGDNANDLSLFESVSIRFAVSNAEQILKDKADFITVHPDGMGVVEVLSSIGCGGEMTFNPKRQDKLC